jgi:hypothetical protein
MSQSSIPLTIEELTPDWLTEAMRAACELDGRVTSVAAQRLGIGAGYVAQVLRVHLEYEPAGAGLASIVVKLPAASEELRRSWWAGYINEWRFYRDLARSVPLSTPRYLGGAGDAGDVGHGLAVEVGLAERRDQLRLAVEQWQHFVGRR